MKKIKLTLEEILENIKYIECDEIKANYLEKFLKEKEDLHEETIQEIKNFLNNLYKKIIKKYFDGKFYSDAIEYFKKLGKEKQGYLIVTKKYLEEKMFNNAFSCLEKAGMNEKQIYEIIANYCLKKRDFYYAEKYFKKIYKDKEIYKKIAEYCLKKRLFTQAENYFLIAYSNNIYRARKEIIKFCLKKGWKEIADYYKRKIGKRKKKWLKFKEII